MKLSLNRLQEITGITLEPYRTAEILTQCGLEVSSVEEYQTLKNDLEGFVVGEVLDLQKHPNADRLKLTKVNVGNNQVLSIVCGAPNVELGQKVIVATEGTKIYTSNDEYFIIKKSKLRGELSEGMLCSENEVGISKNNDGLMILNPIAIPGTPLKNFFKPYKDFILEVELTPNRGDAASHMGVARDILACLRNEHKNTLQLPEIYPVEVNNQSKYKIQINIENTALCSRYAGLFIEGVEVKESPDWLKNHLLSIGLRPINNVVDVTNYVMLETGQPLHAFDADKIEGHKIYVKNYPKDTSFITLDGISRKLQSLDIIISDSQKPLCLAGVFGGIDSGVKEHTTHIFLESAIFNSSSIRKTSKYHNLHTDASFRFERGVDADMVLFALKRAAYLLKEIAHGKITESIQDIFPTPFLKNKITLRYSELYKIAGTSIPSFEVKSILHALDFELLEENENFLTYAVPYSKTDVIREIDVIEEVIRIYGFNNIPVSNSFSASIQSKTNFDVSSELKQFISTVLVSNGFFETINNSLSSYELQKKLGANTNNLVELQNPLSKDLNVMRPFMLGGIMQNIQHNINRNRSYLNFFEFGYIYQKQTNEYKESEILLLAVTGKKEAKWNMSQHSVGFYDIKAAVELIYNAFGMKLPIWHEKKESNLYEIEIQDELGIISMGKINTSITHNIFDIEQDVYIAEIKWNNLMLQAKKSDRTFVPLNKYPEVVRDLALIADEKINYQDIYKLAYECEPVFLKNVEIFDVYRGKNIPDNKKSYALRFTLENKNETLKEQEIDNIMNRLLTVFKDNLNLSLR